jgi:peptidoglycan/LPS O-acetylase OafA/YrhL
MVGLISLSIDMYADTSAATFGMQFFFGMLLSDLSNHPPAQAYMSANRWLHLTVSPILIITGLYIASYPQDCPEWSAWSNVLLRLSYYIFPMDSDVPRFYTGLGLNFIVLGIQLSPIAKDLLATQALLWFGKQSFAVYLLHGTLMRTVLVWMLYGTSVPPSYETMNDMGEIIPPTNVPMRGPIVVFISLPIWLCIVYGCAYLWTTHVDTMCARLTQRLERYVFEEREKSPGLLVS